MSEEDRLKLLHDKIMKMCNDCTMNRKECVRVQKEDRLHLEAEYKEDMEALHEKINERVTMKTFRWVVGGLFTFVFIVGGLLIGMMWDFTDKESDRHQVVASDISGIKSDVKGISNRIGDLHRRNHRIGP